MCWGVKQLDAVNELTSLFAPRSDAGNSLMIDIRSSAKILTYNNMQAYLGTAQRQAVLHSMDKYSCK